MNDKNRKAMFAKYGITVLPYRNNVTGEAHENKLGVTLNNKIHFVIDTPNVMNKSDRRNTITSAIDTIKEERNEIKKLRGQIDKHMARIAFEEKIKEVARNKR